MPAKVKIESNLRVTPWTEIKAKKLNELPNPKLNLMNI